MKQASLKSLLKRATMERFSPEDELDEIDMSAISASDLLASLGMSNRSLRNSRSNLHSVGSPSRGPQMKDPEVVGIMDLQDLSMAEIHQKFAEIYDENNLLRVSLQAEVNIREKLEKKNREISDKLTEARQGLQETRTALINLQAVTEDLIQRKEEREMQLQKVVGISKTYERRIAELETNSVKSEEVAKLHSIISSTKLAVMEKEELMQQLEQQIIQLQQAVRTARNDVQVAVEEKKFVEVKLQHAGDKINQLDLALEKQKEKVNDIQKANMNLESTISSLRDKMADMQMTKVNLETMKMGLETSNSKQKERISEMNVSKQELESKVSMLTRARIELEHKVQELQAALDSKRVAETVVDSIMDARASNTAAVASATVAATLERSALEDRMLALEKMLTSLPMLQSKGGSGGGGAGGNMSRTPSLQRFQQQQQQPPSSQGGALPARNSPATPGGNQQMSTTSAQPPSTGKLARQPSLRTRTLAQSHASMSSSQDSDELVYEDQQQQQQQSQQDPRSRFASEGSSGSMSRSSSQQDFVPLSLPFGNRTKTASMDDGSSLRGKADSTDGMRSKTTSMDESQSSDPEVRAAVERTARAVLGNLNNNNNNNNNNQQESSSHLKPTSPSSILRKTVSAESNYSNNNNNNNNNSASNTPVNNNLGGSRVSFSLDNNSVHVIPNKEKESRSAQRSSSFRDGQQEKDNNNNNSSGSNSSSSNNNNKSNRDRSNSKDRDDRQAEKEKEKEREREQREKEKEKEQKEKEKRERREREKEEERQRQREEAEKREREEKEREREREKEKEKEREREQQQQREKEKEKEKDRERSSESRSRKSMMAKQSSSKNLDNSDAAAQVRTRKTEINNLISQHRDYKNRIKEFTEKFKAEHGGAEPSKEDRKSLAGDVFKTYEKLSKSIKKKMKDLETFQAANNGVGVSTKNGGPGTPSTKLLPFEKSTKSPRTDDEDNDSVSSDDSDDS